jgi:hypothetical protein
MVVVTAMIVGGVSPVGAGRVCASCQKIHGEDGNQDGG